MQLAALKVFFIQLYNSKLVIFFNVGIVQLIIDTVIMFFLAKLGFFIGYANIISRAIAAIVGCYLNHSITFKDNKKSTLAFTYVKFIPFWLMMTIISSNLITYVSEVFHSYIEMSDLFLILIKLLTEGFLFVISYLLSQKVVFRR
jgi:putative flippase GtrA